MRKIILFVILLFIAIAIGIAIHQDPGYLLMAYRRWTVEMPLWLGFVIVLVAYIILYYLIRLLAYLFSLSSRISIWSDSRRFRKARQETNQGLIELAEGNWERAERYLKRAAGKNKAPLINYLSAARAAQEQEAYDRRDNYIRLAHRSTPEAEVAVGLTQAELQLRHGQLEQALATLKHLQTLVPNHRQVIKMLQKLYAELKDWQHLLDILPKCRRYKVLNDDEITNLEKQAFLALLQQACKGSNIASINRTWHTLPKQLSQDKTLLTVYATKLLELNENSMTETLLRQAIKKSWHESWVELFGRVISHEPSKQLAVAETWLKNHPNNPTLLLSLGRIAKRCKLSGQARHYLEESIQLKPQAESYYELGDVLEQLGDTQAALTNYRHGLTLTNKHK